MRLSKAETKKRFFGGFRAVLTAVLLAAALSLAGCGSPEARAMYEQAAKSLTDGDYAAAEKQFGEVIAAGEYVSESYRGLGLSQMYLQNFAEACINLEKSLLYMEGENESFERDVNLYLAYCRERHGEKEKAREIYSELLQEKEDPNIYFLRGKLYVEEENAEAAVADFDKASELSNDYDLFINIYEVYAGHGKNYDGSAYLEKALQVVNSSETDYYNKGLVYYYLQEYENAKDNLIQAMNENPDDGKAILLLGRVYLSMNDLADARAMFNEHIVNDTNVAAAYDGLAMCDIAEENYESALANVQAGLARGNLEANKGLRFNEIIVYEHLKDWETAKQKAADYVLMYPLDEAGMRENQFLSTR